MSNIIIKGKILFLALVLGGHSGVFAQGKRLNFGLNGFSGVSSSFVNVQDSNSTYFGGIKRARFSYSFGFELDYKINDKFSILTGVNFLKMADKSSKFPPDQYRGLLYSRTYSANSYFIEVPLNFCGHLSKSWIFMVGSSFLYNVKDNLYMAVDNEKPYAVNIENYKSPFFGVTANLGIGYEKQTNAGTFRVMPYSQFNFVSPVGAVPFIIDNIPSRKYVTFGLRLTYLLVRNNKE